LNGSTSGEKLNKQPATINCSAACCLPELAEVRTFTEYHSFALNFSSPVDWVNAYTHPMRGSERSLVMDLLQKE
jgi:hypothetical protein